MRILGISAYYHDSAAALVVDGTPLAAAQEERFTRRKHDPAFPTNATRYCLAEAGVSLSELDAVVFYEKPFIKFERLLETYVSTAPRSFRQFRLSIPLWLREKLFQKGPTSWGASQDRHSFRRSPAALLRTPSEPRSERILSLPLSTGADPDFGRRGGIDHYLGCDRP